jgi:hypothetical protein
MTMPMLSSKKCSGIVLMVMIISVFLSVHASELNHYQEIPELPQEPKVEQKKSVLKPENLSPVEMDNDVLNDEELIDSEENVNLPNPSKAPKGYEPETQKNTSNTDSSNNGSGGMYGYETSHNEASADIEEPTKSNLARANTIQQIPEEAVDELNNSKYDSESYIGGDDGIYNEENTYPNQNFYHMMTIIAITSCIILKIITTVWIDYEDYLVDEEDQSTDDYTKWAHCQV